MKTSDRLLTTMLLDNLLNVQRLIAMRNQKSIHSLQRTCHQLLLACDDMAVMLGYMQYSSKYAMLAHTCKHEFTEAKMLQVSKRAGELRNELYAHLAK